MSGGSYNYMFTQNDPSRELLEAMAARLDDHGFADMAASTRALITPPIDDKLREAWRTVEWMDSADMGYIQGIQILMGLTE